MTAAEFDTILDHTLSRVRSVLASKAGEYAATDDRLHNFKADVGGLGTREGPTEVCWGYLRKHLQSIYDMACGIKIHDPDLVDEKIGDAINYMILMKALFLEPLVVARRTGEQT